MTSPGESCPEKSLTVFAACSPRNPQKSRDSRPHVRRSEVIAGDLLDPHGNRLFSERFGLAGNGPHLGTDRRTTRQLCLSQWVCAIVISDPAPSPATRTPAGL